MEESPPTVCTAPGCDLPHPCPLHPLGGMTVAREVSAHLASVPTPPARGVLLRFPWGAVPVATSITIGRDFASSCGEPIRTFDNVSRRHAQLTVADDGAYIEDLASTNGTTVNGNPSTPHERYRLNEGDVLGFGDDLRAVVNIGSEG